MKILLVLASKNKMVLNKAATLSGFINFIFLHTKAKFRCIAIKREVILHQPVYLTRLIITLMWHVEGEYFAAATSPLEYLFLKKEKKIALSFEIKDF